MLGSHEEAEEATQDIFVKVYRYIGDFRGDAKISSWIYRIAANVCITRLKKKQLKTRSIDQPIEAEGTTIGELIPDEGDTPDEQAEKNEMAKILRDQIRELPAKWSQAITLHHFQGFSYEEVAEVMQIPRATVATYILRARKQLAKMMLARTA